MIININTGSKIYKVSDKQLLSWIKQIFHSFLPIYLMFKLPVSFMSFIFISGYIFTNVFIYQRIEKEENLDITPTMIFLIIDIMLLSGYIESIPD